MIWEHSLIVLGSLCGDNSTESFFQESFLLDNFLFLVYLLSGFFLLLFVIRILERGELDPSLIALFVGDA